MMMQEPARHTISMVVSSLPGSDRFDLLLKAHPAIPENCCTDLAELMLRNTGVTPDLVEQNMITGKPRP